MRSAECRIICLFLFVILTLNPLLTFPTTPTGGLQGYVYAADGKTLVPGVKIILKNISSKIISVAETNLQGTFKIDYLKPGRYSVELQKTKVKYEIKSGISIRAGKKDTVSFVLKKVLTKPFLKTPLGIASIVGGTVAAIVLVLTLSKTEQDEEASKTTR